MKKILPFFIVLFILVGCKKDLVKEPKRLIEREEMVNIMYDLSLLEAMKVDNPSLFDSLKNSPNQYIFKKYKIDSIQFVQSNIYYASDSKEYQKMFEKVKVRLEKEKIQLASLQKAEAKKEILKAKNKKKLLEKKQSDSIKRVHIEVSKTKKKLSKKEVSDSIKKAKTKAAKAKMTREIDSLKRIVAEQKRRQQIK